MFSRAVSTHSPLSFIWAGYEYDEHRYAEKMLALNVAVVLALTLAAWKIATFLAQWRHACRCLKGLPSGNYSHWLWGVLPFLKTDDYTVRMATQVAHDNEWQLLGGWFGPFIPVVGVYHPAPLHQILKQPKNERTYRLFAPWLGDGLLISKGKKWARNRRLLTPAFHFDILKPYVLVYNSCLEELLHAWSAAARSGHTVRVFEHVSLLSLDIILQCAFSYKSECQGAKNAHPYIKAVYDLSRLIGEKFLKPLQQVDWLYWLTSSGRQMARACTIVHEFSERVIKERKASLNIKAGLSEKEGEGILKGVTKTRKYCDFLDVLLTVVDSKGKGLTDLEIRDEADTFMFEGHDTTTSGISWTLYCLAKNPEHQAKVREEVRSVLMGREQLEYEDLKDLHYTHWAIKEAMRLYPPVFLIFREAEDDLVVNGVLLPKGVMFIIYIYAMHHNPSIWENPDKYDPMRFHPSVADTRDPLAYIPFSAGSRNCIGQNFAMNEEKVVVATIINQFELSLVENHKIELTPNVILKSKNDIELKLKQL